MSDIAQNPNIDTSDESAVAAWAKRLDVTSQQIQDAVAKVGSLGADVEMHLKGTRSSTNEAKVEAQDGKSNA